MNCMLCDKPITPRFACSGFNLFWCQPCDLGRLGGEFTPEKVASFYPNNYYTHGREEIERPSSFTERLLKHLAWRVDRGRDIEPGELPPGKTICDIGCGDGRILRMFKTAGFATTGVEPDPMARKAASDAGTIHDGIAEQLPALGKYDVVLMSHVLEHCIDPQAAVRNAKTLLAPGGTLVIEVPNNAALGFRWLEGKWPWTDIPRHLSFFTEQSLRSLLERSGLEVTNTYYTGYTIQFTNWWRDQIPGNSFLSGWPLLLASAFGPPRMKYDSVRVHARHQLTV